MKELDYRVTFNYGSLMMNPGPIRTIKMFCFINVMSRPMSVWDGTWVEL